MQKIPSAEDLCLDGSSIWPGAPPVWQDDSKSGRRLIDYLEPKIHRVLKQSNWKTIVVRGCYDRGEDNIINPSEKHDRGYNWQRPTAQIVNEDTVYLNCIPTASYVLHYASMVSTYLKMSSAEVATKVEVELPQRDAMFRLFEQSNLADMGDVDVVIVGYLDACPAEIISRKHDFAGAKIEQEGKMFSWCKRETDYGYTVAYLGCAVAIWGDAIADLALILEAWHDVKCMLYIGRVGTLDAELRPNEILATGEKYYLDGKVVCCPNILSEYITKSPLVQKGSLVSVISPLCEDSQWLHRWRGDCRWVDCETAHIAEITIESDTKFGYLHVVSDCLDYQYPENLANEDDTAIQLKRAILFKEIDRILDEFLVDFSYEPT